MKNAKDLIKVIAFWNLFEGTQLTNAGILRAVGAQLYGSIVMFIGLYIVGMPIGLYLLFSTTLRSNGYFIGAFIGLITLIILQVYYIVRIDWIEKAKEAHEFAKVKPTDEEISNNQFKMVNPNFESSKDDLNQKEENELFERKSASKTILKEVFKRLSIFIGLILVLVVSIYLHGSDIGRKNRNGH